MESMMCYSLKRGSQLRGVVWKETCPTTFPLSTFSFQLWLCYKHWDYIFLSPCLYFPGAHSLLMRGFCAGNRGRFQCFKYQPHEFVTALIPKKGRTKQILGCFWLFSNTKGFEGVSITWAAPLCCSSNHCQALTFKSLRSSLCIIITEN